MAESIPKNIGEYNREETYCLKGIFKGGSIILENGEEFNAMSYQIIKEKTVGKLGYYNVHWVDTIKSWVIFQYILI